MSAQRAPGKSGIHQGVSPAAKPDSQQKLILVGVKPPAVVLQVLFCLVQCVCPEIPLWKSPSQHGTNTISISLPKRYRIASVLWKV